MDSPTPRFIADWLESWFWIAFAMDASRFGKRFDGSFDAPLY